MSSEHKRHAIVIPAYNSEKTLSACLESLVGQSLSIQVYEIIVVDDGSTDSTANIAKKFPVTYIHQDNQGPAAARNRGAKAASGGILLFTDSDCTPDNHWLEEMVAPFKDPTVVGVKGAYKTMQKELAARFAQAEFEDRYDLLRKSSAIDMVDTYSAAFRKDAFLRMGGFDTRFPVANNEDTDLSYRMANAGFKLVFNPDAYVYHIHPKTVHQYLKIKFWRGYWRMSVYRNFPGKAVRDSYTPNVIKLQTILMALSLPLIVFSVFFPFLLFIALSLWGGILTSSIPFFLKTYPKDKQVAWASPVIILLRSASFAFGCLFYLGRHLTFRKSISR